MPTYIGLRYRETPIVYRLDEERCERLAIPPRVSGAAAAALDWGHIGAKPRWLALALLLDVGCTEYVADRLQSLFMRELTSGLPRAGFVLNSAYVERWLVSRILDIPALHQDDDCIELGDMP